VKEVEKETRGNDSIQINLALNQNFRRRGGVSYPKPLNLVRFSHITSDLPVKTTEKGEKKREKIEINNSLLFKQPLHPTRPGSNVQVQGHKQKKKDRKRGKSL